jgi:hypothetical protein
MDRGGQGKRGGAQGRAAELVEIGLNGLHRTRVVGHRKHAHPFRQAALVEQCEAGVGAADVGDQPRAGDHESFRWHRMTIFQVERPPQGRQ